MSRHVMLGARHVMFGEYALDQKQSGVLVTYRDGTTRLVINARLTDDKAAQQNIVFESARPMRAVRGNA